MPEDIPLAIAGIQIADGQTTWRGVLPVVMAGVALRDLAAWTLGRVLGARLLEAAWFQKVIPPRRIDRARHLLADRGPLAVVAGRFMVGFRVPVFLAAGASGISLGTFAVADGLAMLVAVPLVVGLGEVIGAPLLHTMRYLSRTSGLVWGVLFVAVVGVWWWRRSRRGTTDPDPDELDGPDEADVT